MDFLDILPLRFRAISYLSPFADDGIAIARDGSNFDSRMGECLSLIIDQGQPGVMLVLGHKCSKATGTLTAIACCAYLK